MANYEKTYLFHEVAQRLQKVDDQIQVYWISVNRKLSTFLKSHYGSHNS